MVGRGFLRNYATYLGVEATEIIHAPTVDYRPAFVLCTRQYKCWFISPADAPGGLSPERRQHYYEPEGIEERQPLRLGPIVAVVGVVLVGVLLWWSLSRYGDWCLDGVSAASSAASTRVAAMFAEPTPTPTLEMIPTATTAALVVGMARLPAQMRHICRCNQKLHLRQQNHQLCSCPHRRQNRLNRLPPSNRPQRQFHQHRRQFHNQ